MRITPKQESLAASILARCDGIGGTDGYRADIDSREETWRKLRECNDDKKVLRVAKPNEKGWHKVTFVGGYIKKLYGYNVGDLVYESDLGTISREGVKVERQ